MNKTLSIRLRELKNKGKFKLGNPKSGHGHGLLREQSLARAFHYKVSQSFSHSSNGVSPQKWS